MNSADLPKKIREIIDWPAGGEPLIETTEDAKPKWRLKVELKVKEAT